MQESLVGYLLGALDERELAAMEAALRDDPALRHQLKLIARSIRPLQFDNDDDFEPPSGMAHRACQSVWRCSPRPCFENFARRSTHWTLADATIVASVLLAVCLLIFPAVLNSKTQADNAFCQNNLRLLHLDLMAYADGRFGYLPQIPASGPMAVAGMYAAELRDHELLSDDSRIYCAASDSRRPVRPIGRADLESAAGQHLSVLQSLIGGDYGFVMGYLDRNGVLRGIRNDGRNWFPIMADAPDPMYVRGDGPPPHRNVLFASGRVQQFAPCIDCLGKDDLFRNARGEVAAGIGKDDVVIGASGTAPILMPTGVR